MNSQGIVGKILYTFYTIRQGLSQPVSLVL